MDINVLLDQIQANDKRKDRYSLNLYRFLRKKPHYHQVFLHCGIAGQEHWDPERTLVPAIFVGLGDAPFILGARLSEIICKGGSTQTAAHALFDHCVEITDAFWARYIEIGKCAIDPEHTLYADSDRYAEVEETRRCRWCGRIEHVQEELQMQRRRVWVPMQKVCVVGAGS